MLKNFVHILSRFGARLDVGHFPLVGQVLRFFARHFALCFNVHLIADQNERHAAIVALHSQDLLTKLLHGGKRFRLGDRENAQKPVAAAKVVVSNGGVVLLTGGVW